MQAQLLLLQLAQEPLVCQADRAVLRKYAGCFAWRLHAISEKRKGGTEQP